MKKLIAGIAVLAIGAITAGTASADGPRRGSIKDAAPPPPTCGTSAYNWNGAFAGVQLGTAEYRSAIDTDSLLIGGGQREDTGFTVGGVIGYNWQKCNTVFGIEGEFNYTDVDRPFSVNLLNINLFNARSTMDWYSALKLRTGFAFDNLLLYLTGGIALANIEHTGTNNTFGIPQLAGLVTMNNSDTRFGWVAGAGTEYALTNRITWRSEVTYTRFEESEFNLNLNPGVIIPGAPVIPLARLTAMDEVWLVRTGINFKF